MRFLFLSLFLFSCIWPLLAQNEENREKKHPYKDYKWYDRSAIYGGVVFANFNSTERSFSNPFPKEPLPGFEIGINVLQRSERYFQHKIGASYQRFQIKEQFLINGVNTSSILTLNVVNAHVTPVILSYRHKLFRAGIGAAAYGAYIFNPQQALDPEAQSIYTDRNTTELDYGFQISLNLQYHYFFIEAKWINSLYPYYKNGDQEKRLGIFALNFQLLLE